MIRKIINILNKILLKKNRVVIQMFPNFEDNGVAIANYLSKHYTIPIYLVNPTSSNSNLLENVDRINILRAKSLKSIYYLITSKYIFFTHGTVLNSFSNKQISFNLWHGYPYKAIGIFLGHTGILADYTASTSSHCQEIFSKIFDVDLNSVKITGFPRNDRLFGFDRFKTLNKFNIDESKFVFFWLPTYRKSVVGVFRTDGVDVGNPFCVKDFDVTYFNDFLKKNNAICIVKPHPMAPRYEQGNNFSNVIFIDDDRLHDNGLTLYPLLGVTDCLISDLSSVIVDYVLVDKPIICYAEDIEQYRTSRGLIFENLEEMIPGPLAQNKTAFYNILNEVVITKDLMPEKRRKLRDFFHQHVDNMSTKRVVDTVFKKF
jgi:CDP-glycerol glycerophosphotransferase (TagB/SpsB family)